MTDPIDKKLQILGTRYVLAVKDLKKSAEFYKVQLGFTTVWDGEGWHFLEREKFIVMLGECPDEKAASEIGDHSYFAYIDVENIDVLYRDYFSRKVEILSHLENKPWMQREFSIRTIDGHRITFGENMRPVSSLSRNVS